MDPVTKVLVVDDEVAIRMVLQKHLTEWGYLVSVANDGEEALRILETEDRPTLVLLDWMMPIMDGVSVCRKLQPHRDDRPYIIMLTSRSQTSDLVEALNAGADDFITKPVEPVELRARILVGLRLSKLKKELLERAHELESELNKMMNDK